MFAPPPPPIPTQPLFLPPEGLAIPRSARSADAWNNNNNNSGALPSQEPLRRFTQRQNYSEMHAQPSAPSFSSAAPTGSPNGFTYEDRLLIHMLYQQQQAMQVQLNQMSLLMQQLQLSINSGLLNLSTDELDAARAQHFPHEADAQPLHRRSPYHHSREAASRLRHPQAARTTYSNASVVEGGDEDDVDVESVGPSRRGHVYTSSAPRGASAATASRHYAPPPTQPVVAPSTSPTEVTASHAFYTPPLRQSDEHRSSPISTLQQTRSADTTQFRVVETSRSSSSAVHGAEAKQTDEKQSTTHSSASALQSALAGGTSTTASAPRESGAPNAWMDARVTSRILSSVSSTPMGSRTSVLGKENPLRSKLPLSRRSASDASSSHGGYYASANISSSIDEPSGGIQSQERPRLRLSSAASSTSAPPAKHVQPKLSAVSAWRPHGAGGSNSAGSSLLNASSDRSGSNATTIRSATNKEANPTTATMMAATQRATASDAKTAPQTTTTTTTSKPKPIAPPYDPVYPSAANPTAYNDESQSDGYGSYETKQYLKHRGLI